MQRKRKNKIILVLLIVLFIITGCSKEKTDALKFKEEFESYNDISSLQIDEDNPFVYKTHDEILKMVDTEKAFVIFYANPQDKISRDMVSMVIKEAKNSKLSKVYYVEMDENESHDIVDLRVETIPTLVSIIRGKVSKFTGNNNEINSIIAEVALELSTCDIDVGC